MHDEVLPDYNAFNDRQIICMDFEFNQHDILLPSIACEQVIIPYFHGFMNLQKGLKANKDTDVEVAETEDDEENLEVIYPDALQKTTTLTVRGLTVTLINTIYHSAIYIPLRPENADQRSALLADTIRNHRSIRNEALSATNKDLLTSTVTVSYQVDQPDITIPVFPSIVEICRIFNLNHEQQRAMYISGKALLTSFFDDDNNTPATERSENQSLLFIHGLGGSGKSVFIRALTALSTAWLRPDAVMTCAATGNAAVNVSGYTIDSLILKKPEFFLKVSKHKFFNNIQVCLIITSK
jgi:hypothetical protein